MIRQAVAATRSYWPDVPALGMITFLDRKKVKAIKVRGVETYGRTWKLAGFKHVGETKGGLMALQLLPEDMPPPERAKPRALPDLELFNYLAAVAVA